MKLLKPGNRNTHSNKRMAIDFITGNILNIKSKDYKLGTVVSENNHSYCVSAYAETGQAFIKTPDTDIAKHSIYASGLCSLMLRQLKDGRLFIYEVEPSDVKLKQGSSTAPWNVIKDVAKKYGFVKIMKLFYLKILSFSEKFNSLTYSLYMEFFYFSRGTMVAVCLAWLCIWFSCWGYIVAHFFL